MALWLADRPLVLASQSAIRRNVLEQAGLAVEVIAADLDERAIERRSPTDGPDSVAKLLARAKAQAVADRFPDRLVLGADQVMALGARRFSKPPDRAAARAQLQALRGQTHVLHSGVALMRGNDLLFSHVEPARLTMRDFSDDFLDAYLNAAGDRVLTSVGAFQLEALGVHLFERIEGDHFTILGLPLLALLAYLRQVGLVAS